MTDENNKHKKKDIDHISGVETTGHEWDGLKELNNPLPRWWLWIFFISVIWSFGYFVLYPSFPTIGGSTQGTLGYTQEKELAKNQSEIIAIQEKHLKEFSKASFNDIMNNPELYAFAVAGGQAAFKDNCATCHGTGAEGSKGYPNLNDDDWLWGGKITDIYQTLEYGIRAKDDETRVSQMPSFGKDGLLNREQINSLVDYVMALSTDKDVTKMAGHELFQTNCSSCHGEKGEGNRELGAAKLNDAISLYGSTKKDIYKTIYFARAGVMPNWNTRLDDNTIKQLSIYVHQLGGGEKD